MNTLAWLLGRSSSIIGDTNQDKYLFRTSPFFFFFQTSFFFHLTLSKWHCRGTYEALGASRKLAPDTLECESSEWKANVGWMLTRTSPFRRLVPAKASAHGAIRSLGVVSRLTCRLALSVCLFPLGRTWCFLESHDLVTTRNVWFFILLLYVPFR